MLSAHTASGAVALMRETGVWNSLMGFAIDDCAALRRLEQIEQRLSMPPQVWPRLLTLLMASALPAENAVAHVAQALGLPAQMQDWMRRTLACLAQLHGPYADRKWQDLRRNCSHEAFTLLVALRWAMEEEMEPHARHYRAMLGLFS